MHAVRARIVRVALVVTALAACSGEDSPGGSSLGPTQREVVSRLQADGKIVTVGRTATYGSDFAISRHLASGALDTAFGMGGTMTVSFPTIPASAVGEDVAHAVAVQGDGKIVVAGYTKWGFGATKVALARYNP
jgi:uncharacterized delta-60 repeat protein